MARYSWVPGLGGTVIGHLPRAHPSPHNAQALINFKLPLQTGARLNHLHRLAHDPFIWFGHQVENQALAWKDPATCWRLQSKSNEKFSYCQCGITRLRRPRSCKSISEERHQCRSFGEHTKPISSIELCSLALADSKLSQIIYHYSLFLFTFLLILVFFSLSLFFPWPLVYFIRRSNSSFILFRPLFELFVCGTIAIL